jgi:hypothetical protein
MTGGGFVLCRHRRGHSQNHHQASENVMSIYALILHIFLWRAATGVEQTGFLF